MSLTNLMRTLALSFSLAVGLAAAPRLLAGEAAEATTGAATAAVAAEDEEDEYAQPAVNDPFEKVNRSVFKFNDGLFRHVVRPISRGYETVTPPQLRRGLVSFFDNVRFPVRFTGCVLQGKFDRAAAETGKFVVNTTAGVGGFIKVSDRFPKLRVPDEDIGQALGKWGLPAGPYLVLPVLGPANPREILGRAGDYVLTPTSWGRGSIIPEDWQVMSEMSWEWRLAISALDTMSAFPELVSAYDTFNKAAVDPYVAFRNGFLQYREAMIRK
jgi:phospholipid-binding lipoprotein MlaA